MEEYILEKTLTPLDRPARPGEATAAVLTSDELAHSGSLPGLEAVLHHTPLARDVRVCKAETRRDCLCGTVRVPRRTRSGAPIAFGYLLTGEHLVLCDDSGAVRSALRRLSQEPPRRENGPGRLLCELLEMLVAKDPHHLEELEDQVGRLEDQILAGTLEHFSAPLTAVRKEAMDWLRYFVQLGDMVCELEENGLGTFSEDEQRRLHTLENHLTRLRSEAQLLREYCLQVRELFQAEVEIRQNRIMKILTVVTTLCLPLSLVAGWYGMNFAGMPELEWKYGYPAVIVVSAVIVALCLWIMKKKRFW